MSKYGKHLKNKEYLKQTRQVNREQSREKSLRTPSPVDDRSNWMTFSQWCEECTGGQLFAVAGVLSILGSDGLDITSSKLGGAPFNEPAAIDAILEEWGYYKSGDVLCGEAHYDAPKVRYLEWFNQKFNKQ